MSFLKRLEKLALVAALGGSLLVPQARAQDQAAKDKTPPRRVQSVKEGWTWGMDSASLQDRLAYHSLSPKYRVFANKSFMERFEIREEWEQKDFLRRDRERSALLKKNPNATIEDLGLKSSVEHLKLADYPCAESDFMLKIMQDQLAGRLTYRQAKVAQEVCILGRPLATIDPNLSYAEQLELCGFDVAASVARGKKITSLSARDLSIYIAQDQNAEAINDRNEEARRDLRIRFEKEKDEEYAKNHGFFDFLFTTKTRLLSEEETKGMFLRETINGKDVGIRQPNEISYSIYDEVTRKVAAKIAAEEQATERAKKAKQVTR